MLENERGRKKKILFVDDEPAIGQLFKNRIESTGPYEVKIETRGTNALSVARSFRPDLIFLDIMMPDMEGSEVALQIKEDSSLQDVPIVFLTAAVTPEEVHSKGGVIGGQTFLAKPWDNKQLLECIERHLQG